MEVELFIMMMNSLMADSWQAFPVPPTFRSSAISDKCHGECWAAVNGFFCLASFGCLDGSVAGSFPQIDPVRFL